MRAPPQLLGINSQPGDAEVTICADHGNGVLEPLKEYGESIMHNQMSCYVLTAQGCVTSVKVVLRSEKSMDIIDLVVDGVLRNSATNSHHSRMLEKVLDRAMYQQKANGKKAAPLQYCQMEMRARYTDKGKSAYKQSNVFSRRLTYIARPESNIS